MVNNLNLIYRFNLNDNFLIHQQIDSVANIKFDITVNEWNRDQFLYG